MLNQEEYIEQAFFFRSYQEHLNDGYSTQEILRGMKNELLGTTNLPMAIDIILTEVKLSGQMSAAMKRLPHYFTPFQTFIIQEAERDEGRFDIYTALRVLEKEAKYRCNDNFNVQGIFFYQFETISRNRLGFDHGLDAIAKDPAFNQDWSYWINVILRRQIGIVNIADLIYVRSGYYKRSETETEPVLFGEREGRIAYASRKNNPTFLFAALSRHLGYPSVPVIKKVAEEESQIPMLKQRIELLEARLLILQEELKVGVNIDRYTVKS